jgi:hypothetical protein|tara:strand:- start:592 stop:783 length:192 start_codon:yes stop_codon:yes gene_type:complete
MTDHKRLSTPERDKTYHQTTRFLLVDCDHNLNCADTPSLKEKKMMMMKHHLMIELLIVTVQQH